MSYLRFLFIILTVTALVLLSSCNHGIANQPSKKPISFSSPIEQDVSYMSALGLMRGHLMVAKELLDQGTPEQAEPHLGHPVDEIYQEIKDQLQSRNVPEFRTTLDDLYNLAKYKPADPKVKSGYQASNKAIDQAIAVLPEAELQSPRFIMQVITDLLRNADVEYESGIANNKVVARIEYQDARGFVLYVAELYKIISSKVKQRYPEINKRMGSRLETLKKAFPSVNPPDSLVMSPRELSKLVKDVQQVKVS